MTDPNGTAENRLERRKMRTRAALVRAAQTFIAAGTFNFASANCRPLV